ncbi:hypothetical protein EF903_03800 [Streptomyces sp. WAC05292]|nr:hypothetical protein EF903_03800 [Streptomyces sp. WAC05292]
MVSGCPGSTAPIIARAAVPARWAPVNEKTPRGCERSARGSGARWPPPRRSSTGSAVTADRRAAADNHELSKHVGSLAHRAAGRPGRLTIRETDQGIPRRGRGCRAARCRAARRRPGC